MQNFRDGGEAILESLRQLKIEYVVSSPGSEWSPVWESLHRQKEQGDTGPHYIQCWHEALAVNIATGYTMITGRPQVVMLHAGSGLLQGALSIYSATRAEIPMIVMSGESVTLGEDPNQPMEPQWYAGVSVGGADKLIAPLVKWCGQVRSSATLYQSIIRAGEMAARTPKGPVYVEVPLEYMLQEWNRPERLQSIPSAPNTRAMAEDVLRLAKTVIASENPVIVVEHAGHDTASYDALVRIAEELAIPVIGSPSASCTNFPQNHPLWLGVGTFQHIASADLVLLIGARTPWYPPSTRKTSGRIVVIHDNPLKAWLNYQNLQADEYVEGHIATTLTSLLETVRALNAQTAPLSSRREKWTAEHRLMSDRLQDQRLNACRSDTLNAISVCNALTDLMPASTVFFDETITHTQALRQHLPLNTPQSYFRHGGGGLGQGMGVSLGIKLALPERPVVLLVGDGSLLYNPITQALGASRDYNLPILIIVFNNQGYASMGEGHKKFYPNGTVPSGTRYGVSIDGPAYDKLGLALGFAGSRATTYSEFCAALVQASTEIREGRSFVIDAALDH